jgi:hypothetical protein
MSGRACTRWIWVAVHLATLWSAGLLAGAATLPVYGSSTTVSTRHGVMSTVTHPSKTLVEVNGSRILEIIAIPLAASLLVGVALLRPRAGWVAHWVAWVLTGVVGLLSLLAILTIGLAIVPVTMLLAAACALDLMRKDAVSPPLPAIPRAPSG